MEDERLPVDDFLSYLRKGEVAERFLPIFEAEARRFLGRFRKVPPEALGADHVDRYLDWLQEGGASERELRNYRVVCESLLGFYKRRTAGFSAPPPPQDGYPERSRRIPFVQYIEVTDLGRCRCLDLSVGGLFVETVADLRQGKVLSLSFKLRDEDPFTIEARARVVYSHAGVGHGLAFVELSKGDESAMATFIDRG